MKFQLTLPNAKAPTKSRDTDAGYDLYTPEKFILYSGEKETINLGIRSQLPRWYYAQIFGKSKLASKGVFILGGVVDEGYRGDWGVVLANYSWENIEFNAGDAIAQFVLLPYQNRIIEVVDSLDETDRGEQGIWSG